jgi:dihydroflavonol-4-reductase
LLSGENVTADQLIERVTAITGVRGPRVTVPRFLAHGVVGALGLVSWVRGQPARVTSDVLQVLGRYAWYDTSKARSELGWTHRPLRETLTDTVRWLRGLPSTST